MLTFSIPDSHWVSPLTWRPDLEGKFSQRMLPRVSVPCWLTLLSTPQVWKKKVHHFLLEPPSPHELPNANQQCHDRYGPRVLGKQILKLPILGKLSLTFRAWSKTEMPHCSLPSTGKPLPVSPPCVGYPWTSPSAVNPHGPLLGADTPAPDRTRNVRWQVLPAVSICFRTEKRQ